MRLELSAANTLPADGTRGTLIGRAWVPGRVPGPSVITVRDDGVYDVTGIAPTVSQLLNSDNPVALVRAYRHAPRLGSLDELLANSAADERDESRPWLLAPIDLQAIKAAGVTFVRSLLERVIEEHAKGDPASAAQIRTSLSRSIGTDLLRVRPGTVEAERLKKALQDGGLWSQYLEVGIGPHAEIFTKAQPMAAVGTGADIGLHPDSTWNNPEPELVLVVDARGRLHGATLGNDVNLRDFEGRSALLLGRSKDNNASCAIGPFVRLLDDTFTLEDLRNCTIAMRIAGEDGFVLEDESSVSEISRDLLDLVAQTMDANHQYPDGFVLFTGTMFAPISDRDAPGMGFTHSQGDIVTIAARELGMLANRVRLCPDCEPWTFGVGALMRNLAARGLL